MIRTNNLWAPLITSGRKPWIDWTCVRATRRGAKAAYLEDVEERYRKKRLAEVKFIKVFVAAHGIKGDA